MPKEPIYFLLVDDLEENLLALEALLRRDGLILLKARSGNEALELLLHHPDIALALLDVQMPEMDGFELAEYIRGNERTRHVPIIFLTAGAADSQRRFRGYEAGAVDFLNKPVEPSILRTKADVFFQLNRQKRLLAYQRDELVRSAEENESLLNESQQYAAALRDADRRKDEFLATLAHELRNPLAPIRSGLGILRQRVGEGRDAELCDMMARQLGHLVRLIDDLLDMSRITQNKIELRREHMRLQDALQAAQEVSAPQIEAHRHQLSLDIASEPIWLDADMTRVTQIISNLLNNAAKYTPAGGRIALSAAVAGDEAVVRVSDNGTGLAPEMLDRVFDLFVQAHDDEPQAQGGLGIGLALVRRLVDMHGGRITAESAGRGQGSTFTVYLPLAAQQQAAADTEDAIDEGDVAPLRIVVVDDNLAAAQTIGWMLEMDGHSVTLAHTGAEALQVAPDVDPQVLLLDIGLPGMNGYELCRALREDARFKDAVFIAQTGWGQEKDREAAFAAGFDYHLTKPISMNDLTRLLAKVPPQKERA